VTPPSKWSRLFFEMYPSFPPSHHTAFCLPVFLTILAENFQNRKMFSCGLESASGSSALVLPDSSSIVHF